MTSDKCSCGARDKAKCSKENGLQSGKMCLKDEDCPELPEISIEKSIEISERGRKKLLDWYDSGQDCFIDNTVGVDWKTFIGEKMNQTIEDRMQSIEDQLKEIRKELEESLALYKDWKLEEEFREMLKRD